MWSRVKNIPGTLKSFKQINNIIYQNVGKISSAPIRIEEQKVCVDGVNINYLRTGVGDHPIILTPGLFGSIWSDFKPQIENLDKEKFTIIAWDPPGYGKSIPPNRTFPLNYFRRDATWARSLMKTLGYDQFSLLGWSNGGIASLILAAEYPEDVRKLVVIAGAANIDAHDVAISEAMKDVNTWPSPVRKYLLTMYGEEYTQRTLSEWCLAWKNVLEKNGGVILSKDDLAKIKCPTLIVQGEKDNIVRPRHPKYLKESIKNSRLKIFRDASHNVHLERADEVNDLVHEFLTN